MSIELQKYIDLEKQFTDYVMQTEDRLTKLEAQVAELQSNEKNSVSVYPSLNPESKQLQLDILIEKYKKSIVISNEGVKNTTKNFKEVLKNLGGKWSNNDSIKGWIFVGVLENDNLEESSKFIIDELSKNVEVLNYKFIK